MPAGDVTTRVKARNSAWAARTRRATPRARKPSGNQGGGRQLHLGDGDDTETEVEHDALARGGDDDREHRETQQRRQLASLGTGVGAQPPADQQHRRNDHRCTDDLLHVATQHSEVRPRRDHHRIERWSSGVKAQVGICSTRTTK